MNTWPRVRWQQSRDEDATYLAVYFCDDEERRFVIQHLGSGVERLVQSVLIGDSEVIRRQIDVIPRRLEVDLRDPWAVAGARRSDRDRSHEPILECCFRETLLAPAVAAQAARR